MFECASGLVVGRSHAAAGLPCQDAIASGCNSQGAVAAIADGLGSKARSNWGSHAAVTKAVAVAATALGGEDPEELARRAFSSAATAVERAAVELRVPAGALSTTLSLAIADFTSDTLVVAATGDSVHIVRDRAGLLQTVADAPPDAFANVVQPLSCWSTPRIARLPLAAVDAVILSTDGLEQLLLRRPGDHRWPSPNLCHELMDGGPGRIDQLLRDPALRGRTEDDCSVLVLRRHVEVGGESVQIVGGESMQVKAAAEGGDWAVAHPGLQVLELPWGRAASEVSLLVKNKPAGLSTLEYSSPLIAWPQAVVADGRGGARAIVIRHPGTPPATAADLEQRRAALHRVLGLLEKAGLSHGRLVPESFAVSESASGDGGLTLVDVAPLMRPAHSVATARDRALLEGAHVAAAQRR